ncbi:MAG: tetraacyldisaccharide 4'-kinase [Acidobacteria bacterium]|nr:tetraacyldisaccharide 4'-kinase [Acidobacteriota bacterium]
MNRLLLLPLAWLYRLGLWLRRLYFRTFRAPVNLGRPAIKVGNITVGGTGKTPFVIYLARLMKKRHLQPVVLTRGFRRRSSGVLKVGDASGPLRAVTRSGDEARLIADQARCPVYVCEDRLAGARTALQECPDATFILDDAYQQIRIDATLNLLLIDATNPFDNGWVLPAGRLREPLHQIGRADAIIVTRADHAFDQDWLIGTLKKYNRSAPLFFAYHEVVGVQEVPGGPWSDVGQLRGRSVAMMCAIANPRVFEVDVMHQQIGVRHRLLFPDHHAYRQADVDRALREAEEHRTEVILTTEKDAVKLEPLKIPRGRIYALGIEARVDEEENFVEYLKMFIDL